MVGDGEAETGPLATAWHSKKFLNPLRDGAVTPILRLNGYKILNPTAPLSGCTEGHKLRGMALDLFPGAGEPRGEASERLKRNGKRGSIHGNYKI